MGLALGSTIERRQLHLHAPHSRALEKKAILILLAFLILEEGIPFNQDSARENMQKGHASIPECRVQCGEFGLALSLVGLDGRIACVLFRFLSSIVFIDILSE